MSLTYMNGTEAELGKKSKAERKEARQEKKAAKKEKKAEKKEQRKKERQQRKEGRKGKGGKGFLKKVAKVGAAPARLAFLEATKLNFLKLAKRLKQAYEKDKVRVEQFWTKLGGDTEKLKEAIEKGSKSKLSGEEMGSFATTLAAATPIILAALKLFFDLKSDKTGDNLDDDKEVENLKDEMETNPDFAKDTAEMGEGDEYGKVAAGGTGTNTTMPFSNTTLLLGAAAVGAFFLLRKKR